eukprot:scaffold198175_cov21-Tisochrysis_lutea.AAC.1
MFKDAFIPCKTYEATSNCSAGCVVYSSSPLASCGALEGALTPSINLRHQNRLNMLPHFTPLDASMATFNVLRYPSIPLRTCLFSIQLPAFSIKPHCISSACPSPVSLSGPVGLLGSFWERFKVLKVSQRSI